MFQKVFMMAMAAALFNNTLSPYSQWIQYAKFNNVECVVDTASAVDAEDEIETEPEVDEYEVDLLAHLIYCESESLGATAMYYTGSVVLNRVSSDNYPDTIYNVIHQKGQYACISNGAINRTPSDEAFEIARDLLVNGSVLPSNVVYQAEFVQGSSIYTTIGNTYYCCQ